VRIDHKLLKSTNTSNKTCENSQTYACFGARETSGFQPIELVAAGIPNGSCGASPCENVRESRKRRTVFSIAFFG